jgi:hypothetical protein
MAEVNYPSAAVTGVTAEENVTVISRPNWGAIWAGMFTFITIWSVFGFLGLGIFASTASPSAPYPITGMNVGIAAWSIILTIIAMFVAGRVTGQLAQIKNARDGMMHGMIMFGLSAAATLLIVVIGGNAFGNTNTEVAGNAHNASLLGIVAYFGWALFVAFFLGWLAAMFGASSAQKQLRQVGIPVQRRQVHA